MSLSLFTDVGSTIKRFLTIMFAISAGWSRNGVPVPTANVLDSKNINVVLEPHSDGPQTISTPYGNYVKVQSALPAPIVVKRK